MANFPASWFRKAAIGGLILALVMVVAMEGLLATNLPWWLHIPLTVTVLTLMPLGALSAGIAWVEFKARLAGDGEQPQ